MTRLIVRFLRELSVIVTGIAITAGIGLWMNNINIRKDQKQYLDAIKLELEENVKQFDYFSQWLQKSLNYARYIETAEINSLNKDTLHYYSQTDDYGCGYQYTVSITSLISTNAFEAFKFSGAMRQVKNKELLQSIWEIYAKIEMAQVNIDRYFRIKEEEVMRYARLFEEGKTIDIPMQVFYSSGMPFEMVHWSTKTSKFIKETLSKFE